MPAVLKMDTPKALYCPENLPVQSPALSWSVRRAHSRKISTGGEGVERAVAGTNKVKEVNGTPAGSCPFIGSGDGGAAYRPQDAKVVLRLLH